MPKLPRKKEGDTLGAGHINTLSRAAEHVLGPGMGMYGSQLGGKFSGLAPYVQRVAIITDDGNDPIFEFRLRYFDPDDDTETDEGSWKTNQDEGPYFIDANALDSSLSVDDKIIVWWDPQRNMWVPAGGGGGKEPDILRVKNETGCDFLGDAPVVGLGERINEDDEVPPLFKAEFPRAPHAGRFAILSSALENNKTASAVISGAVPVRVLVNSEADEFADIEPCIFTRLQTVPDGGAQILWLDDRDDEWQEGEEDVRWAIVRLSNMRDVPGTTTPCPGVCHFMAVEEEGTRTWMEVENLCGRTPTCPCPTTTTTPDPESTTTTEAPGSTTTADPCDPYQCVEPVNAPTEDQVDRAVLVERCCGPRSGCTGTGHWTYDESGGQWSLESEDCSESCVPENPTVCPDFDTCMVTNCRPVTVAQCDPESTATTTTTCAPGSTTTTTTTTTEEPTSTTTTTCDPSCGCYPWGCGFEWDWGGGPPGEIPPGVVPCSFVCTPYGWMGLGNWCPSIPSPPVGGGPCGSDGWPGGGFLQPSCKQPDPEACTLANCGEVVEGSCSTSSFSSRVDSSGCVSKGGCVWTYTGSGWALNKTNCSGGGCCSGSCGCNAPTIGGGSGGPCSAAGNLTATACECLGGGPPPDGDGGGGDCPPCNDNCCNDGFNTTTTTADPCGGNCLWSWSDSSEEWSIHSDDCEGEDCQCSGIPGYEGECDGQIQSGFCSKEFTTTTSTTTTSTTTTTTNVCCAYTMGGSPDCIKVADVLDCPPVGGTLQDVEINGECALYTVNRFTEGSADSSFSLFTCCEEGAAYATQRRCNFSSGECEEIQSCGGFGPVGEAWSLVSDCSICTTTSTTTGEPGACCYQDAGFQWQCYNGVTEALCNGIAGGTFSEGEICIDVCPPTTTTPEPTGNCCCDEGAGCAGGIFTESQCTNYCFFNFSVGFHSLVGDCGECPS